MASRLFLAAVPPLLFAFALAAGASCGSAADEYPTLDSGLGTGATTGTTTATGTGAAGTGGTGTTTTATISCSGEPKCNVAADCPVLGTTCLIDVCNAGCCAVTKATKGTSCGDAGTTCDGMGHCANASCTDMVQDGMETDVDCGGPQCMPCSDGEKCKLGTDCMNMICGTTLTCVAPTCADGVQNGEETDVDCGGGGYMGAAACPPCTNGQGCMVGSDCSSLRCISDVCTAASCSDGIKDGTETDVDCGGPSCGPCSDGQKCGNNPAYCQSDVCTNDVCQVPTCNDGAQNGNETDVDCGGGSFMGAPACPKCPTGEKCKLVSDCVSLNCVNDLCTAASCSDGIQDGMETDVDCGGPQCMPCPNGKMCAGNAAYCQSHVCTGNVCQVPTCNDGEQNGNETDVDCGGGSCPKCPTGEKCKLVSDCVSLNCVNDLCTAASCSDGIQDGMETDVDCGGPQCASCPPGKKCSVASDCAGNTCQGGTCQCPSGMQVAPIQGGGIYCIDSIEVTNSAYNVFFSANPPTGSQDTWCSWNVGWAPSGGWPYPPNNASFPVSYVNWCQAAGYCKYMGRRLCGKIGGGSAPQSSVNDYTTDQWFNACSLNGVNCPSGGSDAGPNGCYPYGSTYKPTTCDGYDSVDGGSPGPNAYTNLESCQGGPVGLLNMSGNVAEWEDSCSATSGPNDRCAVRGGSYLSSESGLRCDSAQTTGIGGNPIIRSYSDEDVGFRCCL